MNEMLSLEQLLKNELRHNQESETSTTELQALSYYQNPRPTHANHHHTSAFFNDVITPFLQKNLFVFTILAFGLLLLIRLKKSWGQINSSPSSFQVISKHALGPKTFLVKVDANNRSFLLGFHENDFKIISEWDEPSHPHSSLAQTRLNPAPDVAQSALSDSYHQDNQTQFSEQNHKQSVERLSALIREKLKQVR